jgi:hypothetical protein
MEKSQKKIPPEDLRLYSLALKNQWTKQDVYHHSAPEIPFFVYDSLMLPWVLTMVLEYSQTTKGYEKTATKHMTRATLRKHFRVTISIDQTPTVVRSNLEAAVDGMLVGGLTPEMAARTNRYTGSVQLRKELEEVEVETSQGEKIIVCAYVYVWKADKGLLEAKKWSPLEYMRKSVGPNIQFTWQTRCYNTFKCSI